MLPDTPSKVNVIAQPAKQAALGERRTIAIVIDQTLLLLCIQFFQIPQLRPWLCYACS